MGGCPGRQRSAAAGVGGVGNPMIAPPTGVRVYLACGYTDMRKGAQGLTMLVQQVLAKNPFAEGTVYAFRGRRSNLLKSSGTTASVFACSAKDWNVASSSGPRQARVRSCCPPGNYRRCWRAASGARQHVIYGQNWQAEQNGERRCYDESDASAVLASFQFHGSSVARSFCLVCPVTIRVSTSVSQASGSTSFNLALWINDAAIDQCRPPLSEPANNEFFLVMTIGLMARSTAFVSMSRRPSSRKRVSPVQWVSEYRIALARSELPEIRASRRTSHSCISSSSGRLRCCRTDRRCASDVPRISDSILYSAAIRCRASPAIGEASET